MSRTTSRRQVFGELLGAAAAFGASATLARAAHAQAPAKTRKPLAFPKGFMWGTATAAYQVEGAAAEDGRGPSVWDKFSKAPGKVFEGHTGDVACDHYHRYKEDVALLKQLGVRSYRMSISWSRVLPEGRGTVNEKGLDFYARLFDELGKAGIEPNVTLFHWDFPQALEAQGGWRNRDVASWFADYATVVVKRFGDRVTMWATQNEPQVYCGLGHLNGTHAPGLKLPNPEYLTVVHNSLRAHGAAVAAIRAAARPDRKPQIGYVSALQVTHPASDKPEDIEAARWGFNRVEKGSPWSNSWYMDPAILGRYPEEGLALLAADMPKGFEADLASIKQPLDWMGLNIYTSTPWRRRDDGKPAAVKFPPGYARSGVDWQPIVPEALYWGPRFAHERYQLPVYITENGLSTRCQMFLDGKVHDPHRVDYIQRVLPELAGAIADGVPVRGYYHWSMLDNFEWADGYKQRFGLVYVDYQSLRRVPKDSFYAYQKVVASNGRSALSATKISVRQVTAS